LDLTENENTKEEQQQQQEQEQEAVTVHQGKLVLDSGLDPLSSFANKGIGRYSIQTSTSVALELTIAFWLEESEKQQDDQNQQESDYEEELLCTPIDQDVLRFCQAGDYLTFYVKSDTHPVSIYTQYIKLLQLFKLKKTTL
jgi:hypothetical protein